VIDLHRFAWVRVKRWSDINHEKGGEKYERPSGGRSHQARGKWQRSKVAHTGLEPRRFSGSPGVSGFTQTRILSHFVSQAICSSLSVLLSVLLSKSDVGLQDPPCTSPRFGNLQRLRLRNGVPQGVLLIVHFDGAAMRAGEITTGAIYEL
jgi:hypothetical protein